MCKLISKGLCLLHIRIFNQLPRCEVIVTPKWMDQYEFNQSSPISENRVMFSPKITPLPMWTDRDSHSTLQVIFSPENKK